MLRQQFRSPGFWFDALFLLLSVLIMPRAGRVVERLFEGSVKNDETSFMIVMILIVLGFLGRWTALLILGFGKRKDEKDVNAFFLVWLLQLPATIMAMAFLIVAIVIPLKDAGIVDLTKGDAPIGLMGLSILGIEALLLYRFYGRDRLVEFTTPTLVFCYTAIFGYVFVFQSLYQSFLSAMLEGVGRSILGFVFALIMGFLCFLMFYVGPRSLLISKEENLGAAVLRMMAVFIVTIVVWALF